MVFEKLKELLAAQLDADASEITMETDIKADLGADSLDIVEMVMSIEDEFGVEVADEGLNDLATVGEVVEYVESLL